MRLAIEKAKQGIKTGQSPFGCAIARGDTVLAVSHNIVWATTDITAHAEVTAIRVACHQSQSILLEGCMVATTCEPCPMCMSALHWARVEAVYYGATISDAAAAGFNELHLAASDVLRLGSSSVRLVPDTLRDECVSLFGLWKEHAGHAY